MNASTHCRELRRICRRSIFWNCIFKSFCESFWVLKC